MPLHHHRSARLAKVAYRSTIAFFASVAGLATTPAAAQQIQQGVARGVSRCEIRRLGIQEPTLLNMRELRPMIGTLIPAALTDSGSVYVKLQVRVDGTVDSASAEVVRASNPAFAGPVAAIAPRMRFTPAKLHGVTVPVWLRYRVAFPIPERRTYAVHGTDRLSNPELRNRADVARALSRLYPAAQRDSGVAGAVVLRFKVMRNGVADPDSIEAALATDPVFEEPAVAVARRMRFRPARIGGRPVPLWVLMPVHFSLKRDEAQPRCLQDAG